jgi:formate dehydrogenase alpha subunit
MISADAIVPTTCPYCGVGCQMDLHVRGGVIFRVAGRFDNQVNFGNLCVKGRFGVDYVDAPDRLARPLVRERRGHDLRPATWDEALDLVARRLTDLRSRTGPDSIGFLASAKCTNEENYLLQKLARGVFGTNNVDHCARLCHASSVAGLAATLGSGAMTNSINDIIQSDVLLVIGSNTTETHPVIALQMKKAVRKRGAKLILIDPRRIELAQFAYLHLRQRPGTDVALVQAMAHVILREHLERTTFIRGRTEGFEAFRASVQDWTPARAQEVTGVPAASIEQAARLYATAERAAIFWAMGITQHTTGTDNVKALSNLALLCGQIGRPGTGLNPLRGQNNVQGACDMGGLPNVFPAYQPVAQEEARRRYAEGWDVPLERLSPVPGLTVTEMVDAVLDGRIRGLFFLGENPMLTEPDLHHVEKALRQVEFLAVQDIFLNETGALADVVLPGVSFAEKAGTYTNTERRVQLVRPALNPHGEARQDWRILTDLANRCGAAWSYDSPAEIFEEMARLTPSYSGMSHARLEAGGLQWPCPTPDHPGTPILHTQKFTRGLGLFVPVQYIPPAELPDEEYPLILSTGRVLFHWHGGTLSRRSPGLDSLAPQAEVEIHPEDAERLGVSDGQRVRVRSRRGEVVAQARITRRSPPGTIFMTFHYAEAAVNLLTIDAVDPVAKIPEYKVAAVSVEPVDEASST